MTPLVPACTSAAPTPYGPTATPTLYVSRSIGSLDSDKHRIAHASLVPLARIAKPLHLVGEVARTEISKSLELVSARPLCIRVEQRSCCCPELCAAGRRLGVTAVFDEHADWVTAPTILVDGVGDLSNGCKLTARRYSLQADERPIQDARAL